MNVLIGCEESGVVRDAFRAKGHEAFSCDLIPSRTPSPYHIEGDLRDIMHDWKWDLMIAHPPCDYLTNSAAWAFGDGPYHQKIKDGTLVGADRWQARKEAAMFFIECYEAPIPKVCIENPVGCMSTAFRKPDQYIQPYEFGEDASKKTCLWLKNLPKLPVYPENRFDGRIIGWMGKPVERWSNQTDSGQNRLGPSPDRAQKRSQTYLKIALAMAETWG